MSRYSAYTHWFVLLNKREQEAFTLAFVWLALKPNLTMSGRRTLTEFERVWFAGKDFYPDRTFEFFVATCRRHHVKIEFMRKPEEVGRRGERGVMAPAQWDKAEADGSYWPASKHSDGTKKTAEEIIAEKAKFRTKVKLLEMAKLGVAELTYSREQIEVMVERKVDERVREIEPSPRPVVHDITPRVESTSRGYEDAYELPRLRVIAGGKAA